MSEIYQRRCRYEKFINDPAVFFMYPEEKRKNLKYGNGEDDLSGSFRCGGAFDGGYFGF